MRHLLWLLAPAIVSAPPSRADACGGLVQPVQGTVGVDVQRAFFSVRSTGTTDIVLQIVVPEGSNEYGIIVPVPAEPALASMPVEASEFEDLDAMTQPLILRAGGDGDEGNGCGCGGADKAGGLGNGMDRGGVVVGQQLTIGPVTAVTLSGDTGGLVRGWLMQNGFVAPSSADPIIDTYAGAGKWFVAFKRSSFAAGSAASTVGVHMTVPGDRRDFAIRMASVGARSEVAITVFVAATAAVGTSSPWQVQTLDQLDKAMVAGAGYRAAVRSAVAAKTGRAFVIEGVYSRDRLPGTVFPGLMDSNAVVTRLTSVLEADEMTADVVFNGTAPAEVPNTIQLESMAGVPWWLGGALALLFVMRGGVRRSRVRTSRP